MPVTKAQFDAAAARLLGENTHAYLVSAGFNRADICLKIAKEAFTGSLKGIVLAEYDGDIATIREIARNLWDGNGDFGFAE